MNDTADLLLHEFTVSEYHRIADLGLFVDHRVELLDGIIVEMSPIGDRHWHCHAAVTEYLHDTLGKRAFIVPQGSFPLGEKSEPQPDIAILERACASTRGAPQPSSIFAIVEIADSSLLKDIGRKARLYARFGIADYCVVDLNADMLLHYREPHALGYAACDRLTALDRFELAALPGIVLEARAFLGG
jgi:Uma2 family endonuclease